MKQMPEVELRLSDGLMYAHKGKIDAMSGTIDTGTGSVSLRATFPNPERMLRNGGSGTVVFPYQMDNVLVVPQGYLRNTGQNLCLSRDRRQSDIHSRNRLSG